MPGQESSSHESNMYNSRRYIAPPDPTHVQCPGYANARCSTLGAVSFHHMLARSAAEGLHPGVGIATAGVLMHLTPAFLVPRHRKRTGKNSLEGQVRAECASRGLPAPACVEELPREWLVERRFLEFIRSRREKAPPQTRPFGLRLTFAEPVSGPLCLGYAAHFGLGVFAAVAAGGPSVRP